MAKTQDERTITYRSGRKATLPHQNMRPQKNKLSDGFISLPAELRQRVLLNSLDNRSLETKASLVERVAELSTIHKVFRDDMSWVRQDWLLHWKELQNQRQIVREGVNSWVTQMTGTISRQHVQYLPQLKYERPCRACRWNWKDRKWNGIKALCRDCRRRGIRRRRGLRALDMTW